MKTISGFGGYSSQKLLDLRRLIQKPLPACYLGFLFEFNGGVFHRRFVKPRSFPCSVEIDVFFGLGLKKDFDLFFWNKELRGDLPSNLLIFGSEPYGNVFVINLEDASIFYWDHLRHFSLSTDHKNAYPICCGFENFLELLNDEPDIPLHLVRNGSGTKDLSSVWYYNGKEVQEISRTSIVTFKQRKGFGIVQT